MGSEPCRESEATYDARLQSQLDISTRPLLPLRQMRPKDAFVCDSIRVTITVLEACRLLTTKIVKMKR